MINTKNINPFFNDNYVAIAVTSSNEYVPYLSVYLSSIKEQSSKNFNYDVVVLEKSITDENKQILKDFFEVSENLSLRFFNPEKLFINTNMPVTHSYLCKESYFRLSAPLIFKHYTKLIFTDIDLIFNDDPSKLYNLDMKDSSILSVIEPVWSNWINIGWSENNVNILDYTKNILKISDPERYFNTGVMLMDISKLNSINATEKMISRLSTENLYLFQDQDIINEVINNQIGVLPFEWNYEIFYPTSIDNAKKEIKDYCKINSRKIIHWIGPLKPWIAPERDFTDLWWRLAAKTPYLTNMIHNLISYKTENLSIELKNAYNSKLADLEDKYQLIQSECKIRIKYLKNQTYYYYKYYFYKILNFLLFGKLKNKRNKYKNIIRIIRSI